MDEWQYLINGTVTAGTFNGPGQVSGPSTLHAGDLGYAPKGSAHWLRNEGEGHIQHPLLELDTLEWTGRLLLSASMQLLMGMSAAGLP